MLRWLMGVVCLAAVLYVAPVMAHVEAGAKRTVVLSGSIEKTRTLRSSRGYLLQGGVYVRNGATLRIAAGTVIRCEPGSFLSIEPGGRIEAMGTVEAPIVFTSARPPAERSRGDWGGIIVSGYAPVSAPGSGPSIKNRDTGSDVTDSSGILRFVRIEYAGTAVGDGFMTALAFRGVGSETVGEFVQTLNSAGCGVSLVGGTVNLRNIVSTGNLGDGLNWSAGWTGKGQFLVTQQRHDVADPRGVALSADTNYPRIENATFVGGKSGVRLSSGARGEYRNVLVLGSTGEALNLDDPATLSEVERGLLTLDGLLLHAGIGGRTIDGALRDELRERGATIVERDPLLANAFDEASPDFRPVAGSPALLPAAPVSGDTFFTAAPFIGAFGDGDDWTTGWTNFETPPNPRYLANASSSPEALARDFLAALAANDVPAIMRHRITQNEFCFYVWPELPASALPNVTCDFAWSQATLNSLAGLHDLLNSYRGRRFEFVSLRFAGGTEQHATYKVHYDTRVTVQDESGAVAEVKLFGSMLELNGQFKLFSHVID